MATIFYTPTIDFTQLRQRPQQLLSVAAKRGHKIIYCNLMQESDRRAEEVEPNLFVYYNSKTAVRRNPDIDILYFTWAQTMNYIDLVNPKLSIFDNVDNFSVFENDDKLAIKKADITLVASQPLYDLRKDMRSDISLVRNGCTNLVTKQYDRPSEYGKDKIVLFTGAVGAWCDTDLMEKIAKNYRLVIVGEPFGKRVPKGSFYIPSLPHDKMLPYIQHADCCILPFDNSDVAIYSCPIKTYEYLQFNKPVVSTDIPESRFLSEKYPVFISKDHDEFMSNIYKSFSSAKKPFAESFVKEHSWESRWDQIEELISSRGILNVK